MTPYELVARYFLPEIKALVALELLGRGFSQLKVSKLLGISQAMVNKYVGRGREYFVSNLEKIGFNREEIESMVSMLVKPLLMMDVSMYNLYLMTMVNRLLASGRFCRLHHKLNPSLPSECRVCYRIFYYTPNDPFILEFMEALDRITSNPLFYKLIPEVGMNIVYSPPDARDYREYIGITGRILRSGDGAIIVGKPARGGSRHVARVLWLVKKIDEEKNVCASIRYDKEILSTLKKMGLQILYTGPHEDPEKLMDELERSIKSGKLDRIDVVADEGGRGLEPIIYVFARSLDNLVSILNKLLGGHKE